MWGRFGTGLLGVAGLALAGALFGAVVSGQERPSRAGTIDVSEIRPGMRGYGLTVFRGTTPDRFDVEVIDVLHGFRPDQDLILIRTDHPILDHAHIVAGMSGSPIYLDNRLAGAYAYGWQFSQDPIAGVTPIRNMLREMRRPVRSDSFPGATPLGRPRRSGARTRRPSRPTSASLAGLPAYRGRGATDSLAALRAYAQNHPEFRSRTASMAPAATPLLLGGFDDAVVSELDDQLSAFGLMVLQAGGAGARTPSGPTRFAPGSAVGVQLVRGDISATAVGTVTAVEGRRAAAFGHPMMNAGETGLPTAMCRVLHILSSQARSFKISEPVRGLGTLVHDRQSAIVVDSGLAPARVRLRVRVEGVSEAPRTEWNMEVASHRVLTPVLIGSAIRNAMVATVSDNADVMVDATTEVTVSGRRQPIELHDQLYSRVGAANPIALRNLRLFGIAEATYGNPFERARLLSVDVRLRVRFARETLRLVDASVAGREVDPGDTVPIRLTLQRYGQAEEVRIIPVTIPDRLAGQNVEVRFEGGGNVRPVQPFATDLDGLLSTVQQRYSNTAMVVSVRTPARGLRFAGHVVRHLPPSALDSLQLRNDADRNRPFITFDRRAIEQGEVVNGHARVDLVVRRVPRR